MTDLLKLSCAGAIRRQQELLWPLVKGQGRLTGASCSLLPFSSSPQLGHCSGTKKQKMFFWQWVSLIRLCSIPACFCPSSLTFFFLKEKQNYNDLFCLSSHASFTPGLLFCPSCHVLSPLQSCFFFPLPFLISFKMLTPSSMTYRFPLLSPHLSLHFSPSIFLFSS